MPALDRLWETLRANPRLRLGLWLIGFILWGYGLLLLDEHLQAARADYTTTASRHARALAIAADTAWPKRLRAIRALEAQVDSRLWREASPGLAQATFQDWLGQAMRSANFVNPLLAVSVHEASPDPDGQAGTPAMWKASARLSSDFTPAGLAAFLKLLAEHDKAIVVESLVIKGSTSKPRVELSLAAYFQPPAREAGEPATGGGRS
jgi:hypothetical protein